MKLLKTENAINSLKNNVLYFIVDLRLSKPEIRKMIEENLKVKVKAVRTHINAKGEKIAIVKLDPSNNAEEIFNSLGE